MAVCQECNREMTATDRCDGFPYTIGGKIYPRIAYGFGQWREGPEVTATRDELPARCHDCGVTIGALHHPGCDMEECPNCHKQAFCCSCDYQGILEEAPDIPTVEEPIETHRVKTLDSLEEGMTYIQEQEQRADRVVQPWQARLKPGDCYITSDADLIIYGEIIEDEEGTLRQNYHMVRAFSEDCPEGEAGIVHVASISAPLSRAAFERAGSLGWPNTKEGFHQVVDGEPGWRTPAA